MSNKTFKNKETYHFYLKDGTPCHGTIEEGKAKKAFPSVTTSLSIIRKEAVEKWKIREAVAAALLLPKDPKESIRQFADRCIVHNERMQNITTDFGTQVHKAIENYHLAHKLHKEGKLSNPPTTENACLHAPEILAWVKQYEKWFQTHVEKVLHAEKNSVCLQHEYAGQVDAIVLLKSKKIAILDFKTQNIKEKLPWKNGKPLVENLPPGPSQETQKIEYWPASFYETWILQLAAYKNSLTEEGIFLPQELISIVINSQSPQPIEFKIWPKKDHKKALEVFLHTHNLWKWINNF